MPPDESVKIMINWEDPLIIDVLRQMDRDAEELGRQSITSYLITLMPKEKASRIMYLMTQL
jgi:flagellar protein FlbB